MDPLSDVLALLKPVSHVSAGFDVGGDWSVQFTDMNGFIKCYAIVSGACWLAVEGVADPVRLKAGESFVLPSGRPFRLAGDLALEPVDAHSIFPPARQGGIVTVNGGGDLFLVGSRFAVQGAHAGMLLGSLPPIIHLSRQADQAALRWLVERMMLELSEPQPGGFLIAQHLAHIMLMQALRLHLAQATSDVGWFFALADKQISAAIAAIHGDPARRWTLHDLAKRAGMSRSNFALRFKETVGETPMGYLARWRMVLAADRMENSNDPVSAIGQSLGYESESSFSMAFKRVMGCAPRQYARRRNSWVSDVASGVAGRAGQ